MESQGPVRALSRGRGLARKGPRTRRPVALSHCLLIVQFPAIGKDPS